MRAALLYDSNCGVCRTFQETVASMDWKGAFEYVPLSDPRAEALLPGMAREMRENSFHVVLPGGRVYSADEAVPQVVRLLPGGGVAYWFLKVPGMKRVVAFTYDVVRRNRWRLSKLCRLEAPPRDAPRR